MMWRGLQFALVVSLLGAAPLFALEWGPQITVSGMPSFPSGGADYGELRFNGIYDEFQPGGYKLDALSVDSTGYLWRAEIYRLDSGFAFEVLGPDGIYQAQYVNGAWELWNDQYNVGLPTSNWSVLYQGGGFGPGYDPFDDNFPDWESAAVKIPLGFTFAMSFWAAAVGLSIGMKWVRDLASAAS